MIITRNQINFTKNYSPKVGIGESKPSTKGVLGVFLSKKNAKVDE